MKVFVKITFLVKFVGLWPLVLHSQVDSLTASGANDVWRLSTAITFLLKHCSNSLPVTGNSNSHYGFFLEVGYSRIPP